MKASRYFIYNYSIITHGQFQLVPLRLGGPRGQLPLKILDLGGGHRAPAAIRRCVFQRFNK